MINNNVELYVNNTLVDTFTDGLNIRINNKLIDPTKLTFSQSEFSYTFELPLTPLNCKTFNYINNTSVLNKFTRRYDAILYADGITIFQGTFKITGIQDNAFQCNIYTPKVNPLETIFGETKLNEFTWNVPFDGISTISQINQDTTSKYFFPLVSYGLFPKKPESITTSGYRYYTDKYTIDNTNKFYYNSFVPSLNMVELIKQLCHSKGYVLKGDIITDEILNDIYLTNNISTEQDPTYNIGNPTLGELNVNINFTTYSTDGVGNTYPNLTGYYTLQSEIEDDTLYTATNFYNLLDAKRVNPINNQDKFLTVTTDNPYMMIDDNTAIQIPADGWYEIIVDYNMNVDTYHNTNAITVNTTPDGSEQTTLTYSTQNMPLEWQLLRYDADDGNTNNISHEPILDGSFNEYTKKTSTYRRVVNENNNTYTNIPNAYKNTNYITVTAVDQEHNTNLICGAQQYIKAITLGYAKNGKSYSPTNTITNRNKYNCDAYYQNGNTQTTDVNKNILIGSVQKLPTYNTNTNTSNGTTHCIMYLNKNDVLIPYFQQKRYEYTTTSSNRKLTTSIPYRSNINMALKIKAVAKPNTPESNIIGLMNSNFDTLLNLANFCNNEITMKQFIDDVAKAFNLTVTQNNKAIVINKLNNITNTTNLNYVDIDNISNFNTIQLEEINYPSSIAVKFKINTNEEGFYRSAERNSTDEQLQSNNWTDYGDYGYKNIIINNNDDADELTLQTNFSYTWYENYIYNNQILSIPQIADTKWFIEGYDYEENSKYDARSFTQRFLIRNFDTLIINTLQGDVIVTIPVNYKTYNGKEFYLDYRSDNSLLNFFNISKSTNNNKTIVECYLTSTDYNNLTHGALVKFDSDLYKVLEIKGYDPTNINKTTLELMQL